MSCDHFRISPDRTSGFGASCNVEASSLARVPATSRLIGGVNLSFYDWYADSSCCLASGFRRIVTDVPEAGDWYNSQYLIVGFKPAAGPVPLMLTS